MRFAHKDFAGSSPPEDWLWRQLYRMVLFAVAALDGKIVLSDWQIEVLADGERHVKKMRTRPNQSKCRISTLLLAMDYWMLFGLLWSEFKDVRFLRLKDVERMFCRLECPKTYDRRTLQRLAASGRIPGASRKKSGRYTISVSPELCEWVVKRTLMETTRAFGIILSPRWQDKVQQFVVTVFYITNSGITGRSDISDPKIQRLLKESGQFVKNLFRHPRSRPEKGSWAERLWNQLPLDNKKLKEFAVPVAVKELQNKGEPVSPETLASIFGIRRSKYYRLGLHFAFTKLCMANVDSPYEKDSRAKTLIPNQLLK